jgi:E3 ubiquitin ligase SMURF1/2
VKSLCNVYRLYVNWRFLRGIEAQFLALQKGFNEVIPQHLLKTFDEKELEVSALMLPHHLAY